MKTKLTYIIACLLACSIGSLAAQTQEEYLTKANAAHKNQRYDDAITYALKVLGEDCDEETEVRAIWLCTSSYQNIGAYAEAIFYQKKLSYIDSWSAHFNIGLLYAKLGYDKPAIDAFDASIERGNNKPAVYNCKGGVHTLFFRKDEAIVNFNKAISLIEANKNAVIKEAYMPYFNMAVLYEAIDNFEEAELWYKKALKHDPKSGEIQFSIQQLRKDKDKNYKYSKRLLNKILKNFDEVLAKNRWSAYNLLRRGECHELLGNETLAMKDYLQALELYNEIIADIPDAWFQIKFRANVYENLGRKQEALKDYQRVLELNPAERNIRKKIEKLSKD